MVEYYNNTLCVQTSAMIRLGVTTLDNYKVMARRNKFRVMRRGCRATPALVEFDTMPFPLKKAITEKVGDPHRLVGRNAVKELIKADPAAMEYFSNYQLSDGRNLPPEVVTEYYNNAIVLNAVNTMLNDTKNYRRSRSGVATGVWKIVVDAVNALDRNEVPHTLPANERRLKIKFTQYLKKDKLTQHLKEDYASLIHGGYCNQNSRKVTELLERLMLSIYCMENKPYADWVCDYYLQFIGGGVDVVDMRTGELFDRNDFRNDKGEYIIISESTVWNYINNPKNAAIIEATRMTNHRYLSTVRPHYHRHAPLYSFSKISLDDRDLPRKMHDGSRVKAYYAYDVASGALIGAAYSKRKDTELFIDCVRDMFRFITANGWGMPMEIEVEHHLVKEFKDDLAKAGVLFPFVRFCAPGNSQEKHAEQLNRQKKYGAEKRYQVGIGRFYAKDEVNRSGGERVYDDELQAYVIREQTYTFEQLVADDRESIARYNAGPHRNQDKHADKSRLQVLQESVNPNLAQINTAMLLRYIGECTTTICAAKGLQSYEKEAILDGYHVTSSVDLSERQLREVIAKLQGATEADKWRKRVIASIGAWLELSGRENNLTAVKAIACHATGYDNFNRIPVGRLQNIYYSFLKKQRDEQAVQALSSAKELAKLDIHQRKCRVKELEAAMHCAVEAENYEVAARLRDEINNLKSATL